MIEEMWVNIMSADETVGVGQLTAIIERAKPVQIFSSKVNRYVGRTLRYEMRGVDAWALARFDVEDCGARCMGIFGKAKDTGLSTLIAVLVSDVPREQLAELGLRFAGMQPRRPS